MEKHDEYTLYKKESENYIIRFMMAPFGLWSKDYRTMKTLLGNFQKTKPYLIVKYLKTKDKDTPRKKGEGKKRGKWIKDWTSHWWYDTSEKALAKYKSL